MILQSKYTQDENGVKFAPITTPNAVRWSDGSNLNDKLSEKADKVDNPTSGNFVALDANGNIVDSGHKHSDYLTQHQSLADYIQKSSTSGLVKNDGTIDTNTYLTQHQDISGKEDKMIIEEAEASPSGAIVLPLMANVAHYYTFDDVVNSREITLVDPQDRTYVQTIVFFMTMGDTPNVTFDSMITPIYYHDGFGLEAGKTYEVNALFNGSAWIIASVVIVIPEETTNEGE